MRRQSQEEVAAAARRRLELLGRELDQAGLRRVDDDAEDEEEPPALPDPDMVPPAGRHARPPRPGLGRRTAGWVGDQVPETLRGRVHLDPGPVLLVIALVAAALVATAVVVTRMGGDAEAVPPRAGSGASRPLTPLAPSGGAPSASSSSSASPAAGRVTVDVAGKVRRPGVTTLPAGSRVIDALRRAGGARGGVDLTGLNLARVLVDGEQILVGRAPPVGGLAASASTAGPAATSALVNLNTATEEQLDTLPGVGPVTAQKIIAWRTAHGAFSSVDELLEVDGIGDKTLADLAPLVTL